MFQTLTNNGPVDIVSIDKKAKVHLWDVKTFTTRKKPGNPRRAGDHLKRARTKLQRYLGVRLLYVNLDTEEIIISSGKEKHTKSLKGTKI